ncbi:MAG: DUF1565 domain-containing protein [Saccharofermentans sp.]|nr:DUF1565 domain-containing protein [Saccharofermentans sp.]
MTMIYHVSALTGKDYNEGTQQSPFKTISHAAKLAMPGDTVIVHEGEYREWVSPENSGINEQSRITYIAADGERPVIKGSERITTWENVEGNVWKVVLPNSFFNGFNPYEEKLEGDWFIYPDATKEPHEEDGVLMDFDLHLGDVYMNGKSFYEAGRYKDLIEPKRRETGVAPPWTNVPEPLLHPEDSVYQWFAELDYDADTTTIFANFQGANPNEELTEINVRRSCFFPRRTGRNYITVSGFEMCQAACPWTPPTADQPGLLGANWSKGWIIENNDIHDAKCSAISIGKEESTGHNMCTRTQRKPGYQYQMEAVFRARRQGWDRETIGSHIIRNNVIHDCGQNGVVGHMGCIFSTIENNLIYNIAVKHEFFGYEIAGIKLHAAIDVEIKNNNIHNSALGIWLDWQAQGAHIHRNLLYGNDRDLMIEVTHGPYLVENNIFGSEYNFDNVAQGGAYVNNLCAGIMRRIECRDRSTPYHFPHSAEVAGCTIVYGGDDRLYNNIFIGESSAIADDCSCGTAGYDKHPLGWEEYAALIKEGGNSDHEKFQDTPQAVYIDGNAYVKNAPAYTKEVNNFVSGMDPEFKIVEKEDGTYVELSVDGAMLDVKTSIWGTSNLGSPRLTEGLYEDKNCMPYVLDEDYAGNKRGSNPKVGPWENLKPGKNVIKVW